MPCHTTDASLVRDYLSAVYPTGEWSRDDAPSAREEWRALFCRLHVYYRHSAIDGVVASALIRQPPCLGPLVARSEAARFPNILPCVPGADCMRRQLVAGSSSLASSPGSTGPGSSSSSSASAAAPQEASGARYVEVIHLAHNGVPVRARCDGGGGPTDGWGSCRPRRMAAPSWSDFVDRNRAPLWFTHAPGSGVFYDRGRRRVAAGGKAELLAKLLDAWRATPPLRRMPHANRRSRGRTVLRLGLDVLAAAGKLCAPVDHGARNELPWVDQHAGFDACAATLGRAARAIAGGERCGAAGSHMMPRLGGAKTQPFRPNRCLQGQATGIAINSGSQVAPTDRCLLHKARPPRRPPLPPTQVQRGRLQLLERCVAALPRRHGPLGPVGPAADPAGHRPPVRLAPPSRVHVGQRAPARTWARTGVLDGVLRVLARQQQQKQQ